MKTLSACALAALCTACVIPEAAADPSPTEQTRKTAPSAEKRLAGPKNEIARPKEAPDPTSMPPLDPSETSELSGLVDHVERAGPYTYVQLDGPSGGRWVVVMGVIAPRAGSPVTFAVYGARSNFYSRRLDRELDELHFGRLLSST